MTYAYYYRELDINSFPDAVRFSFRRIGKLYLLHVFLVAYIVFRIAWTSYSLRGKVSLPTNTILLNLLLLKIWVPNASVYFSMKGVSWYLCDIFYIFACFPYLLRWIKKQRRLKELLPAAGISTAVALLAALLAYWFERSGAVSRGFTKWFTYVMPLFRLNDYFVGCCAGAAFLLSAGNGRFRGSSLLYTAAEFSVCALICLLYRLRTKSVLFFNTPWFCSTLIWLPTSVLLVFLFAAKKGLLSSALTRLRPLLLIGDLSGYAFLIHPFFISFANKFVSRSGGNKALLMFLAFISTQGAAWLWKRLEGVCRGRALARKG